MANGDTIRAEHLIELQTFTTSFDDDRVLLRVQTLEGGESWYQLPRSSFITLAGCLASDAERLRPRQ